MTKVLYIVYFLCVERSFPTEQFLMYNTCPDLQ